MRPTMRVLALLLTLTVGVTAAACGGEKEIGGGIKVDPGGQGDGALRDPARTTSTVPQEIEDQLGSSTTAPGSTDGATNTTVGATTTTAAPDVILVQDDDQGAYFDPYAYQIQVNRPLVFRNKGKVARVIVFDDLGVKSPDIAPGGEWTYVFEQKGVFDFRDDTRPYATSGRVQVY